MRRIAHEKRRVERQQVELEATQKATDEALNLLAGERVRLGVQWTNTLGDLANSIIESVEKEEEES